MNEPMNEERVNEENGPEREEEMRALEERLAELKSQAGNGRGIPEPQKNALLVPGSIVLAGIIISIAVVYGGGALTSKPSTVPAATPPAATANPLDAMRAISDADHYRGSLNASVKIVEYSDPECPFCKQFHNTLKQVTAKYGADQVVWVYRHFPLDGLHPKARKEAEATECANEQGGNDMFWKFIDALYATTNSNNSLDDGVYNAPATPPTGPDGKPYYAQKQPRSTTDAGQLSDIAVSLGIDKTKFESCLASGKYASKVEADYQNATATGGQGTPHSIVVAPNGDKIAIVGAQPLSSVTQMVDAALTLK